MIKFKLFMDEDFFFEKWKEYFMYIIKENEFSDK